MSLAISLTLAIVPALIIVIYFYRKDRAKPEPKGIIIRIFLLGLLSTVPAIFIEMGFACLENVLYVLGSGITVGILRAFTSIPMHASVSVIMGYWIGRAKFSKNRISRRKLILKGFLLAVFFHGLYDLCIFAIPFWSEFVLLGLLPVLVWAIILARRKIIAALREDEKAGRIPQIC